ncbi:FAD-dependent oxidoreductase [Phytopseudomonas dryadis]|uniref:Pyridine nucleotide-disulfide oxidoreductase n=1 Tax=Phytopseudomonas dryadis TaxID=2487520 RepID=A0A4Q9R023_9GAMM|nr:FAD-dependent oxidoreductase [Pseudomonas dryadis]TBU91957.1 pyridine nucleotide-disulfide oxidoreductase [Pseudomonas dryadis]
MTLHAVTSLAELGENSLNRFEVAGRPVLLVRRADRLQAYQADCPHAGAPLEEGCLYQDKLICPWHKAAFELEQGQVCEPPALTALQRYAVSLIEGEVWVDDQPLAQPPTAAGDDRRCFVVVGAGAAGAAAVATLRGKGYAGRLLLLDQEQSAGYDRTALSKFVIAGQMAADAVPALLGEDFYRDNDVQRISARVTAIAADCQRLQLADGSSIHYDAALLATGATPKRLAIEGADLAGVLVLRSRADAQRLADAARPGKRVVIVGDSFIGLEAASALRTRGLQVHLVARHQVPLSKQLGERIGRALRTLHEAHGVIFHTPAEPRRIDGEGRVTGVTLDNGRHIPADLVLLGAGVAPATGFISGCQLAEDGSLEVDASMRVRDGLWAAGDMVSFPLQGEPTHIEHWRLAQQHARVAAGNMLGARQSFADVPFFWTYHYGKNIEVLGHAREWNRIDIEGMPERQDFIALLCVDERVESVVACGRQAVMALLSQRMKSPLERGEALVLIGATG